MNLISTAELAALDYSKLTLVDASYFLPVHGKTGLQEFEGRHLPGAIFFDIDAIADQDNPLPHMLPDEKTFGELVGNLGISHEDRIVVYDQSPLRSAARAWWSLKIFGAQNVSILDGGLQKWLTEGRPVAQGREAKRPSKIFKACLNESGLMDKKKMQALIKTRNAQIIDARPSGRFLGIDPEPRPGLKSGHVPGALSLAFTELFDTDHRYLPKERLTAKFEEANIDLTRPVISYCGSGVTACSVLFAAHLCGAKQLALYDGSWAEWGGAKDTPVVK